MSLYKYIAASRETGTQEMLIEAASPDEALAKLRSRRLTPVRFLGEEIVGPKNAFSLRSKKIDTFEFTRQLAPLLAAYIPLERALSIIAEGAEQADQKTFVNSLRQGLHEGKKFSDLVRSHGKLFPNYYANLVESGEETGCLPEVLNELYKFMNESRELKNFITSSSIYPLAILGVTLTVTILMFTIFVPKFTKVFTDMGREMPSSMEFLIGISNFFSWAWWCVPLGAVIAIMALKKIMGEEQFRFKMYSILVATPLIGKLAADLEMCRYMRTLSIMVTNHVEIIRTMRISGNVIHNPVIGREFRDIANRLKGGAKLSAALAGNTFVPRETVPMLRVGEESGSVGPMLRKIADNLESNTRVRIKRLLSLFEPVVIVFLALMVLIVVASIFMAMMEMNSIQGGM